MKIKQSVDEMLDILSSYEGDFSRFKYVGEVKLGAFTSWDEFARHVQGLIKKKPINPAFLLVGLFGLSTVIWGTLTCTWCGLPAQQLPGWLQALSIPVISNVYADKIWALPWMLNLKRCWKVSWNRTKIPLASMMIYRRMKMIRMRPLDWIRCDSRSMNLLWSGLAKLPGKIPTSMW